MQAGAARLSDKAARTRAARRTQSVMARYIAALLICAATAQAAPAAAPDLLNSADCRAAREALDAAVQAEPSRERAARIETARQRAAQVCLGPEQPGRQRSGAPDRARRIPAPVISGVPSPAAPAVTAPLPPLAIPRPATVTVCDPGGCWDSEGRRLNSTGPVLMGPRGLCSLQGGVVNCP